MTQSVHDAHPEAAVRFSPERTQQALTHLYETGRLIAGREFCLTQVDGDETYGVYSRSLSDAARGLEYATLQKDLGDTYEELEAAYVSYDASSTFLLAVDMRRPAAPKVAGVMRLLHGAPEQLKSLVDVAEPVNPATPHIGWGNDLVACVNEGLSQQPELPAKDRTTSADIMLDVATITIAPEYRMAQRGQEPVVSAALIRSSIIFSLNQGYRDMIAIMVPDVLNHIDRAFSVPLPVIPGLGVSQYFSVPSRPVRGNMEQYADRITCDDPELSDWLTRGTGRYAVAQSVTTIPTLDRFIS